MTAATTARDTRDYCADMRAVIDTATDGEPYIPGIVATEIVDKLRANDPDLLDGWLHAQAEQFVREAIGQRDRSARARVRHQKPGRTFAEAVDKHDAGDSTELRKYLDMPFTVADGTHRPLATLNRDDLLFVQSTYQSRADENLFYVAFTGALAKKVKSGTVGDHYSEAQMARMFDSFATAA